jgi:MFS family permease
MTLASSPNGSTWRVGTLVYNRTVLLSVFFWMLWGDLCVNIMETVIPRLVPLHLERLGATKAMIGLISASIPAGVELIVNPFVSTYSDRFRSRFGRRRPFILLCTPILALCLVAVGFSNDAANWMYRTIGSFGLSEAALSMTLLGILLAVFQFFNVVVLATYYYMIADVVPQNVIGSFTSLYKVMGAMGGIIFNKFIFPHADTHEAQIYIGCAGIYVVAFMLMGWRVKEGEYPKPAPLGEQGGKLEVVGQWLRESFTIRFYQKLYSIGLFYYFATGSALFQQFFALNDLKEFGDATALAGLIALPVFFVMGPLSDRFHPLRMGILGMALMGASSLASYFLIHDAFTFKLWTAINAITMTCWLGSQISLLPRILPRAQYGQYCSANNTLCAIGKFGAPVLSGAVIGMLGSNRLTYLWTAIFSAGAVVAVVLVYRHWKRLGGDLDYSPPGLPAPQTFKVAAISEPSERVQPAPLPESPMPPDKGETK